ncbi:hypothetical protein Y032_0853g2695 [Ancylostoma ceylanicum]|nr:hypothetical protein Y032_0853g2695 [Ancylostoma ceylanicum]
MLEMPFTNLSPPASQASKLLAQPCYRRDGKDVPGKPVNPFQLDRSRLLLLTHGSTVSSLLTNLRRRSLTSCPREEGSLIRYPRLRITCRTRRYSSDPATTTTAYYSL